MAEDQIRCVHKHRGVRFFRATTAFNSSWQRSTGWTPQNEDGTPIQGPAKVEREKKNAEVAISNSAKIEYAEPIPFVEFENEKSLAELNQGLKPKGRPRKS